MNLNYSILINKNGKFDYQLYFSLKFTMKKNLINSKIKLSLRKLKDFTIIPKSGK